MGCLTYSRQLCLSREYIYILWLESAIGTRIGKIRLLALVACQNRQDSNRSRRERAGVREASAERVRPEPRLARGPDRAMCRWGMPAKAHRYSRTERADECSGTLPRTRQRSRPAGRNVRVRGRR